MALNFSFCLDSSNVGNAYKLRQSGKRQAKHS